MPQDRLIGRVREMGLLTGALAAADEGRGSAILIEGEAGIGKTRLAEEVITRAERTDALAAWGRGWSGSTSTTYWPWSQIAAELLNAASGPPSQAAGLAALVHAPRTTTTGSAAADDQVELFRAVLDDLRDLSAQRTLLLVFDDLHAADHASLLLLQFVARYVRSERLLLLGTFRRHDLDRSHAPLLMSIAREGDRIDLPALGPEDIDRCFTTWSGDPPPAQLVSSIRRASGGNPFFIKEIVRELAATGEIHRAERSEGFRVPRDAQALVEERIARLDQPVRELLDVASVIGMQFEARLLADAMELEPSGLIGLLAAATEAGLLEEESIFRRYAFAHVMFRETLYVLLDPVARAETHLKIARVLEGRGSHLHLDQIAHHLFKAGTIGDPQKAINIALQAAEQASSSGVFRDAARHAHRGFVMADATGVAPDLRDKLEAIRDDADRRVQDAEGLVRPSRGATPSEVRGEFLQQGEYWKITSGGKTIHLRDSKGLRFLAHLVRNPGRGFHCLELVRLIEAPPAQGAAPDPAIERELASHSGELLDAEAVRAYRQRLGELQEEIAEADRFNDIERSAKLRVESDFLTAELSRGVGLGGRTRRSGSEAERARVSVTRALRTAIRHIAEADSAVGDHFDVTTRTGTFVTYQPDPLSPPWFETI